MLARFTKIVRGLVVYPENMARNMDVFGGVIFSQAVMLKLISKGLSREGAYKLVQSNAMKAWNRSDGNFKANLLSDSEVMSNLSAPEVDDCFNPQNYLKNLDVVFNRLGV